MQVDAERGDKANHNSHGPLFHAASWTDFIILIICIPLSSRVLLLRPMRQLCSYRRDATINCDIVVCSVLVAAAAAARTSLIEMA